MRRSSGRKRVTVRILACFFIVVFGVLLLEIVSQVYSYVSLAPYLEKRRADPRHYYRLSKNPTLGYELRPNTSLSIDGRKLKINRWGIRDDSQDVAAKKRKIALLGDSVVFGISHSQTDTIGSFLQRKLDPSQESTKILNFGVPGYGLAEIEEWLKEKNATYRVSEVIYLLNPNDFARRHSMYEGADNGLYVMYHRPLWMSLWILRKAIYRWNKGGLRGSVHWYRWMFSGNRKRGLSHIREMAAYAKKKKIAFSVFLLPASLAYEGKSYALSAMYDDIAAFLNREGIPYFNPVKEFARSPDCYFDETNHLTREGNALIAKIMGHILRK